MRGGVQAVIRLGGGGADSGTIGDDDNAAGRRLGADPRRQRSTRHPLVETPHVTLDELADHAEGLLPAERAATVTAHVATCPTCQAQQARLSAVRTVLAADDAGPMPAAVAARIETALAADQHSTAGPRVPLRPVHPRWGRRAHWGRILAAAASAAVLAGGGALGLSALRGNETVTSKGSSGAAASATAGNATGRTYTAADFGTQVRALLTSPPRLSESPEVAAEPGARGTAAPRPSGPAAGPAPGPAAAAADAASGGQLCVSGLATAVGRPGVRPLAVDQGEWAGRPALVVVLPGSASTVHAYVVALPCDPTAPRIRYDRVVTR